MHQIRHSCNARLFDCSYQVQGINGDRPDVEVRCARCSRERKELALVGYKIRLPHYSDPVVPEKIYCGNLGCLARLCDMALPYMIVEDGEDFAIACWKCKEITKLKLSGVVEVAH